jgi:hypothetical protein
MFVDLSYLKSGFSDKLRVLTFHIALKNLLKLKTPLIIFEKQNFQCPFKFVDHCKIYRHKFIKIRKKYFLKSNIIMNSYNSEISLQNCKKNNPYKNIDNNKLLNEWRVSYKKLIPNKNLQKKINKICLPKKLIGVHLRTTDRMIDFKRIIIDLQLKDMFFKFQLRHFEKKISKIIQKETNIKNIYLASDENKVKQTVSKNLKNKGFNVYTNNSKYYNNFRKTNGEDFLVDLFCLSKSNIIFTTVGGGVPFTAHLLSNKGIKIINFVNQLNFFIIIRLFVLIIFYLKRLKSKINLF